ncbi:MAG: cytochrome P450, partial [Myxococcales bacterium]|nr:cytochrome P450 [Myxococcales bacterium]
MMGESAQEKDARTKPELARREAPLLGGRLGLGVAVELLRDPLAFLIRAHARHGSVFRVKAATRQFVVLAGQSANRFAGADGRSALESRTFWGRLADYRECPHMILAEDGEPHRTQRKHYGDVLSKWIVEERREGCDEIIRTTFRAGPDGLVNVSEQTRLLIARLVHHCLTGGAPLVPEQTTRSLLEVFRWETNTLLLGKWPRIALRAPSYRRHYARAESFIAELARSEQQTAESELGGWFKKVRQGRERFPELFSGGDHRMALLLPFVAGVDTVGATLGFLLATVCRDAGLLDQLKQEVEQAYVACAGPPDVETLRGCPTLFGCVLECL